MCLFLFSYQLGIVIYFIFLNILKKYLNYSIITIVYSFSAFSLNLVSFIHLIKNFNLEFLLFLFFSKMVPFDQINTNASFPTAFLGVKWMFWLTSIGPILRLEYKKIFCNKFYH
jgi:hypothetical protein